MPIVNLFNQGVPHSLWRWFVDALPDLSNLVLLLVGVIMSLPKLAEKIEDYAVARYSVAVGCILLGLFGFVGSVNQRRQATSQMATLIGNTNTLVTNTTNLVNNMNSVVLLGPQVAALNAKVSDFNAKLEAAKEKHDPRLVTDLQAQALAARQQAESAASVLLFAMAPGIVAAMNGWADRWSRDDGVLVQTLHAVADAAPEKERQRLYQEMPQRRLDLSVSYTNQLRAMLTSANLLREELLSRLPGYTPTQEDERIAAVFKRAESGQPIDWQEMSAAARYLDNLAQKFIPRPITNLKATVQ